MEAPAASSGGPATPPEPPRSAAEPPAPPAPPVQVVAAENTPIEGAAPTVKLTSPKDGQLIKADRVDVVLNVKNWGLTPEGNHIHLIIDNEPYIAVRDVSKPIDLGALVQKELGHPLSEGTHVLRAFPGRGHHESVKTSAAAFDIRVFHYKQKTADFKFDAKAPLLTFSRPKGCSDAGSRVLLDFFVTNTELGATGSRVHYVVDGNVSGDITAFTPHYIENLQPGDHQLQLTLQDQNGSAVPGLFNDTSRTIKIAPDCKALAAATAPSPAPAAATTTPAAAPAPTPPPAAVSGKAPAPTPPPAAASGKAPGTPPPNPPLATTPTPSGPTTPPTAAPSEAAAPKTAK